MLHRFSQVTEKREKELLQVGLVSCGVPVYLKQTKPHGTSKALILDKFAQYSVCMNFWFYSMTR